MLPDPGDAPTERTKFTINASIAGFVAGQLGQPERSAGLGLGAVLRAAVPEAAVHKHHGLALGLKVRHLFRSGEFHPNNSRIEGLVWSVDS